MIEPVLLSIAIIAVIVIILLIAMTISRFIMKSGGLKLNASADTTQYENDLSDIISGELNKHPALKGQAEDITQKLTEILNKQIDKKVEFASQEVVKKFDSIIVKKDLENKTLNNKLTETSSQKKQIESVVKSVSEGLIILNDKGEVVMLNPAAEKLLGITSRQEIGMPITSFIRDEQLLSLAKRKGDKGETEIELNAQSEDTKKVLRSSSAVVEDENGQTIGMVSVLTDITKQKELDALKTKFISSVTHELRSPIVAIRNSLSLLKTGALGQFTNDQEKFIEIADRNLERLSSLIDEILDFSKFEAKKVELHSKLSSAEKVITDACDTFNAWAKAKDITIVKNIQKDMPLVNFDPDKITQVIANLFSNSIKFTPKGGTIKIDALLRRAENDSEELVISLSDTGIGLTEQDIPKLFNKFQQVGEKSADAGGTGLGLYISKEIVELHRGKIWAESELNKGSKFTFTIPFSNIPL